MAKKGPVKTITLECTECKNRNYTSKKNTRNITERMELSKFCKTCRKAVVHKETK